MLLYSWGTRDAIHSVVGGCKGEGLPPSVFLVPVSGSFGIDREKRGAGAEKQEKKKILPFP